MLLTKMMIRYTTNMCIRYSEQDQHRQTQVKCGLWPRTNGRNYSFRVDIEHLLKQKILFQSDQKIKQMQMCSSRESPLD